MATGNTRKKTASKRKGTRKKEQEQVSFRNEIILWIVLAVCIILFLANLGVGGKVGGYVSSIFFGIFGLMAYVFPICLFVGTVFTISNKDNKIAVIKLVASILFVLFLCLFVQLVFDTDKTQTALEAYKYSVTHKNGGGFIGGALLQLLCPNFGVLGTYVIDIVVLIISLVLITEKSFFRGMQKGGKVIYDSAKDEQQRRREQYETKKQAQANKRMDKKVSGVALDTKIQRKNEKSLPDNSDELNEIKIEDLPDIPIVGREEHIRLTSDTPAESAPLPQEAIPVIIEEPPVKAKKVSKQKQNEDDIAQNVKQFEQSAAETEQASAKNEYVFPPVSLLKSGSRKATGDSKRYLQETAVKLQQTLKTFGVNVTVTNVSCGPSVTRFEIQPEMGVKVSKIVNLADDIKLNLAAADIRIEAPIPGKAAVGIEVPNQESVAVMFRDLVESEEFKKETSPIAFAAGKDIGGKVMIADIAKMPHVLIAGATGSGKSVCINTIIMSILYRAHPDDVKLIMIDPKVVELSVYNGIPHLFTPVVTDAKKAAGALHWAVSEMMDRYDKFAEYGVRDLKGYNKKIASIQGIDDPDKPKKMPQIIIIVDELADLMMVAPSDVEDAICRLAQLARAAGLHLILATQRPSVNVITGLIKANMPSRIAFSVTSGVDSRTILDMVGAEKLLGKGDMLFYPQGFQKPQRVQGAFVSDKEVSDVVEFVKNQNGEVTYSEEIETKMSTISTGAASGETSGVPGDGRDVLFVDAAKLLMEKDKASIGMLQRYFKIGFNRAARIMDQLEEAGVVGPDEGTKPRQVIMSPEELEVYVDENV